MGGSPIVPYYENMKQSSPQSNLPSSLGTISKSAAPLRRQVLLELRQSIILGRLNPGERLVERELISMMGVSRTVIREALRQLESEGLVAIIPNKGPVVRALTLEEAQDLYVIRAEEQALQGRFDERYRRYCALVPRLLPQPLPPARALLYQINPDPQAYSFSLALARRNKAFDAYLSFAGMVAGLFVATWCRTFFGVE